VEALEYGASSSSVPVNKIENCIETFFNGRDDDSERVCEKCVPDKLIKAGKPERYVIYRSEDWKVCDNSRNEDIPFCAREHIDEVSGYHTCSHCAENDLISGDNVAKVDEQRDDCSLFISDK